MQTRLNYLRGCQVAGSRFIQRKRAFFRPFSFVFNGLALENVSGFCIKKIFSKIQKNRFLSRVFEKKMKKKRKFQLCKCTYEMGTFFSFVYRGVACKLG